MKLYFINNPNNYIGWYFIEYMKKEPTKVREYRVLDEMNGQNAIKLLSPSADRVFQIVEYEDEELQEELETISSGKLVELKLEPVSIRSNVWMAVRPTNIDKLVV